MKEVIESIDRMIRDLDGVLSSRRLKPSERRTLKGMRGELLEARENLAKHRHKVLGVSILHLVSFVARVSELLGRYHQ